MKTKNGKAIVSLGVVLCLGAATLYLIFHVNKVRAVSALAPVDSVPLQANSRSAQYSGPRQGLVQSSAKTVPKTLSPLDSPTDSLAIAQAKLQYLREHFTGQERANRMAMIVSQAMTKLSLEEGLALLQELPTGEVYDAASAALGKRFAELDHAAGIEWINGLPQTNEGNRATMAFFNHLAEINPELSIAVLYELNQVRQGEALRSVLNQLADKNPDMLITALHQTQFSDLCTRYAHLRQFGKLECSRSTTCEHDGVLWHYI